MHALRHFYASWCINRPQDGGQGLPPKVVQERLGHATINLTMDTYSHLFPRGEDQDELAKAEFALLGGQPTDEWYSDARKAVVRALAGIPPTEGQYQEIGRFFHEFPQVEFSLRFVLAQMTKIPSDYFDIVTAPYDTNALCNVVKALAKKAATSTSKFDDMVLGIDGCLRILAHTAAMVASGCHRRASGSVSYLPVRGGSAGSLGLSRLGLPPQARRDWGETITLLAPAGWGSELRTRPWRLLFL